MLWFQALVAENEDFVPDIQDPSQHIDVQDILVIHALLAYETPIDGVVSEQRLEHIGSARERACQTKGEVVELSFDHVTHRALGVQYVHLLQRGV